MKRIALIFTALLTLTSMTVFAHPGRTASDGCHYCRTNCEKWGVPKDQRHCHNGYHDSSTIDDLSQKHEHNGFPHSHEPKSNNSKSLSSES
jgi:hypothetical protein